MTTIFQWVMQSLLCPTLFIIVSPVDIDNWAFTMIYLADSYKEAFTKFLGEDLKIGIAKLGPYEFSLIKNLSKTLLSDNNEFGKEVEIIDCLNSIIDSIEVKIEKKINTNIESIRNYINNNFLEELSLDTLQDMFHIGNSKLIQKFQKTL